MKETQHIQTPITTIKMEPPKAIKEEQNRETLGICTGKPNANANAIGGGACLLALAAEVEEANSISSVQLFRLFRTISYIFGALRWNGRERGDGEVRMQQQKPKTEPAHSSSSGM